MDGSRHGSSLPPDRQARPGALALDTGDTLGEYMAITDADGYATEETPDGGLLVTVGQAAEAKAPDGGFYANLADEGGLPDHIVSALAADLFRKIEEDKDSRKKRDEQYAEGLRRSGLGKDAPGGADFEGAHKTVHPMIPEAAFDFEARIMKELWPPSGPVKPKILGTITKEKTERAKRVTEYMNYQLTMQMTEAFPTFETTLIQVPIGGSQFLMLTQDHRLKRPKVTFVPVDQVVLPASAQSYHSAHRRTYMENVSEFETKQRVESGVYRDLKLPKSSMQPDATKSEAANRKIEGVEDNGSNIDNDRQIFMSMSMTEITDEMAEHLHYEEPGDMVPYLFHLDVTSKQVLGLYRDWEPHDKAKEPIDHLFEFPFMPWRGAFGLGLTHIIGSLSAAATGALRALLDSAHIANAAGGLIRKGSGTSGQTRMPKPTEFQEIEGGMESDDIRKMVMPYQANGPSPVLFQLLGFVVNAAKEVVRTSLDETPADSNTNVPVGTQLSRVEEGLVVFSQIHNRIHFATDRFLCGLRRLNRLYLPELVRVDVPGKEIMVRRRDFEGPPDVSPVSDPTIYSDQQRLAQINAVQQRQAVVPGLYRARAVEERFLKLMKIEDPDELLMPAPQPHELNAVNENLAMAMGRPVTSFPEQEHLAHLQVHLDFMQNPMLGMNPLLAPVFLPAALKHIMEHVVYYYVSQVHQITSQAAGRNAADLMSDDDTVKQAFDKLLAMVSQRVVPGMQQTFANAMPVLQKAQQMLKALQPPPPIDPGQAAVQAAAAETQRKAVADKATAGLGQAKLQADVAHNSATLQATAANDQARNQNDAQRNAIDAMRVQQMQSDSELEAQTKLQTTAQDNDTALQIATQRVMSGAAPGFSTGESLRGS